MAFDLKPPWPIPKDYRREFVLRGPGYVDRIVFDGEGIHQVWAGDCEVDRSRRCDWIQESIEAVKLELGV